MSISGIFYRAFFCCRSSRRASPSQHHPIETAQAAIQGARPEGETSLSLRHRAARLAPADTTEEIKIPSDATETENVHLMQRNVHAIETLSSIQLRTGQAQEESVVFFESQALRLFNNPEHFNNFRNSRTTQILRSIPFDELEAIVDQAIRLITPDMDESFRAGILETLQNIPPEERALLMNQALRLITPDMAGIFRYKIIYALRIYKLSVTLQEGLSSFVDQTLRLIPDQANAEDRWRILSMLVNFPSAERQSVVDQALRLITDVTTPTDRGHILHVLWRIRPVEREVVVDQGLRLITGRMPGTMITKILECLNNMPAAEREALVNQALRLITDQTEPSARRDILALLTFLPPAEREVLVDQTHRLITQQMPEWGRGRILGRLATIPSAEREAVVDQALRLITVQTTPAEREYIVNSIRSIPSAQRETVVNQVHRLITEQMSGGIRGNIIERLRNVPPDEREGAVTIALRFINNQTSPQERIQILRNVIDTPHHLREAIANPAQPGPAAQAPWGSFLLSLEDISQQPETVLHAYASASERAIPRIQYIGSQGIDAGGVTRDFITRLFHSLYPKDPLHARLGSKPDSQQLLIPMTDPAFSDIGLFRDMGVIFGEILSGRLGAPIGNRFSPLLFELLHAFTANDLNAVINPKADPQTYSKLLKIYVKAQFPFMTDADVAELEAGRLPGCLETDDIHTVEQFFEETGIPQVMMAAVSIAKGISSRVSWDHQKRATPAALMEAIQGSLSSQRILNSLTWMNQNGDEQGFLSRWIREADSELLKKFLFCISGSETLGQRPLNIFSYNPANPQTVPAFHTCSLQMDLPRYRSYELFKDKLEYSLAHAAANPASGVSSEEERKGNESFQFE